MKMRKDSKTKLVGGSSNRRGFALLITITLLAFLVLLLVSLASLTRVETQVASNSQKIAQARQNALMALNIAVGQLQKYAGPDNRVTATSALFDLTGTYSTNPNLTGVWNSDSLTTRLPDMWLVSGSEGKTEAAKVLEFLGDPSQELSSSDEVFLVGDASVSNKAHRIRVKKQPVSAPSGLVPGTGTATAIGNYAWWIGDQGVKASLALPDRGEELNYGPWADSDTRRRVRQQIGSSVNYFSSGSSGVFGFDPLSTANKTLMNRAVSPEQFAFMSPVSGASLTTYPRDHFHDFTAANYSVLASTAPSSSAYRGLMQDVSMLPSLLGPDFMRYADYAEYMETPTPGDMRRRYKMRKYIDRTDAENDTLYNKALPRTRFSVAPIISDFMLRFRVSRLLDGSEAVLIRSKMYVSLWNPYTSAIIPEDMYIEVRAINNGKALPIITLTDSKNSSYNANYDLQSETTMPVPLRKSGAAQVMRVKLTFDASSPNGSPEDKKSWLPGRVYSWATGPDSTSSTLKFYTQETLDGEEDRKTSGWVYENVPQLTPGEDGIEVKVPKVTALVVFLYNSAGELLARSDAPTYEAFETSTNTSGWKFGYGFRLKQPDATKKDRSWSSATADLRAYPVEAGQQTYFDSARTKPADYQTTLNAAGLSQYLLYRPMAGANSLSAGNDTPLFELPRQPFLSIGELQHMIIPATKMFAVGNSWAEKANPTSDATKTATDANALFDRFFFSGLVPSVAGPDLSKGQPLPNWNMKVYGATNIATVKGSAQAYSSRYLMQGGAFNINSTSAAAWRAVLSRNRFSEATPFSYVTTGASGGQGGTATDTFSKDATIGNGVPAPVFFRYPQSAQETSDWTSVAGRDMSTQAFRQGIRGGGDQNQVTKARALTTAQLDLLAQEIATLVKKKGASTGPFRTVAQFLNTVASAPFNGKGLLETAIANTSINPPELQPTATVADETYPGFSALTLTAADIMTSLGPYARARSDTFVIRSYGDALNPVTGAVEGRAYAEAVVQRVPDPIDATAATTIGSYLKPTHVLGRRFQIVSFRWLTPKDI